MAILEVKTNYGIVIGTRGNNPGYSIFKGVPYAAPPVGERRFAPPAPLEPWEGKLDCTQWHKTCVQRQGSFGIYAKEFYPAPKDMDEACLYLDIWTPADSADEKLPVFYWMHGGGYGGGFAYEMEFDGEAMCKRGCILVSVEYRCGALGFFTHPKLIQKNGHGGNQGMMDQVAGLRWVYENISAFGGDPENITIHGQSAGAMSTKTLLVSPLCKGILKRAIVQSGGGLNDWENFMTEEEQANYGEQVLRLAEMTLKEAMTLPAEEVSSRLSEAAASIGGMMAFKPCTDGYSLLDPTGLAITNGRVNTDSLMCGSVTGDKGFYRGERKDAKAGAFGSQIAWGRLTASKGLPLYAYYFDHRLPGDDAGAFHSCELWYMFGSLYRCWRPWTGYDYELSDAMVDYWCNFARTGDPNGGNLPRWLPCGTEDSMAMHFSDGSFKSENLVHTAEDEAVIADMVYKA